MRSLSHSLFAAAALSAVGCSGGAAIENPVMAPPAFSVSGGTELTARWWTAFADAELDGLVEEALRGNFDLLGAWHRLAQARAVAGIGAAPLKPSVAAGVEARTSRPTSGGGDGESLSLSLSADYEIDLWGQLRSRAQAERYRARATAADYQTAALTLSAEVTLAWLDLAASRSERDLLSEQIEANNVVFKLLENRIGTGVAAVDLLRQKQLIEAGESDRESVGLRVELLEHRLAVLLGRAPTDPLKATRAELPALPPEPATGVPSELVKRRPDIQRAYNRLLAADRDLASAVSNRYPRLSLSASVSSTQSSASSLFRDWVATLAANLIAPILDGGERAAAVKRQRALVDQGLADYAQATLDAFREVEDALAGERIERVRVASLERQVELANRATRQVELQYKNGLTSYVDVLTALTTLQRLERELVTTHRGVLEYRVALYRALAGGFATERELRE